MSKNVNAAEAAEPEQKRLAGLNQQIEYARLASQRDTLMTLKYDIGLTELEEQTLVEVEDRMEVIELGQMRAATADLRAIAETAGELAGYGAYARAVCEAFPVNPGDERIVDEFMAKRRAESEKLPRRVIRARRE